MQKHFWQRGVTLIELIITIALITLVMGVVIYALNPARQFSQGRNTKRWAHVNTILTAVYQRIADNRGTWSTTCGAATVSLPSATTTIGTDVANTNLEPCLVPTYLPNLPLDPLIGTTASTSYRIIRYAASGRIAVVAEAPELEEVISVTR